MCAKKSNNLYFKMEGIELNLNNTLILFILSSPYCRTFKENVYDPYVRCLYKN